MLYFIYKITNNINGKYYIGCHKTNNIDDGYMGSGKVINRAITKYGVENFTREILHYCNNTDEMFAKEKEIVTEEVVNDNQSYNIRLGGYGGFDHINRVKDDTYYAIRRQNGIDKIHYMQEGLAQAKRDPEWALAKAEGNRARLQVIRDAGIKPFLGKRHTDDTRQRIGAKTSVYQSGKGNSQYGTRWIHSLEEQRSMKIGKDDPIPNGWLPGRKIKF